MKVGIDYRLANKSHRGMARYCREIVNELLALDNNNEYVLIIDKEPSSSFPYKENCRYIKISSSNFIIGEQIILPKLLFTEHFDCFWSPYNSFPIIKPQKTKLFVTVHDVIYFYPFEKTISAYQRIGALYRRYVLKFFHKNIDHIFTVSQFSKDELVRILNVDIPIDVTYNCVDKFAFEVHKICNNNPSLQTQDFFFTVSGDSPSKNLDTVLKIFEDDLKDEKLIVAGLNERSPFRTREKSNIHFLESGVPDEELIKTYLSCKCFLFFSKYEGFGIPLIEAAICNKPILASNTTSIPEILGKYGEQTSPDFDNIKKLITDFINREPKLLTDYTDMINRFNNWRVPAEIILNYVSKVKNDKK